MMLTNAKTLINNELNHKLISSDNIKLIRRLRFFLSDY